MASTNHSERCAEVLEHLGEVVDGTASAELREHVAECDRCRDVRHEAEEARRLAASAGLDHRPAPDLEARVLAALDARGAALVAGLALVAAAAVVVLRKGAATGDGAGWSGTVERVASADGQGGLLLCDAAGKKCSPGSAGARLERGARVRTDRATRAEVK